MSPLSIAAVLMVRNEEKRIKVTLESVKTSVKGVILFDTGSSDNTINIVKDFTTLYGLRFHLMQGEFVDFSVSRNALLDFADKVSFDEEANYLYDYLLLLDSNDEYRAPDSLNCILEKYTSNDLVVTTNLPTSTETYDPHTATTEQDQRKHPIQRPTAIKDGTRGVVVSEVKNMSQSNKYILQKKKKRRVVKTNAKTNLATKTIIDSQNVVVCVDAFNIHQRWFCGGESTIDYYNIRIIKPGKGFRYQGIVHEYLVVPDSALVVKLDDQVMLYQDRVADNDGKTFCRWKKDIKILKSILEQNPKDTRSRYYLAQSYDCLKKYKKSLENYELRATNPEGFFEERFVSMMRCGVLYASETNKTLAMYWFLQAYEVIERAEPLVELAKLFRLENKFKLAYLFIKRACELDFPLSCVLWVDRKVYSYDRWHELGIVAYYVGKFEEGEKACRLALATGYDKELNQKNLQFYELITSPPIEKNEEI